MANDQEDKKLSMQMNDNGDENMTESGNEEVVENELDDIQEDQPLMTDEPELEQKGPSNEEIYQIRSLLGRIQNEVEFAIKNSKIPEEKKKKIGFGKIKQKASGKSEGKLDEETGNLNLNLSLSPDDVLLLSVLFQKGLIRIPSVSRESQDDKDDFNFIDHKIALKVLAHFVNDKNTWAASVAFDKLSYKVLVNESDVSIQTVGNTFLNCIKSFKKICGLNTKQEIDILHNVTGSFINGRPCLVLGPPESGVSTLMKALCGRLQQDKRHKLEGIRSYSGYTADEIELRKACSYTDQIDNHAPTLTVKETMDFSYNCNTISGDLLTDEAEKKKAATDVSPEQFDKSLDDIARLPDYAINLMGLKNCRNTIVGNEVLRGVSGGEKRRVTYCEMVLTRRPIKFCDQISTGLDSAATYDICSSAIRVAKALKHVTVISLLQPSPEVYNLFDEIFVLASGMVMYHGPRENILPYFESIGFRCPDNKDVAEYVQEVVTKDRDSFRIPNFEFYLNTDKEMAEAWMNSPFSKNKRSETEKIIAQEKQPNQRLENEYMKDSPKYLNSVKTEFNLIWKRELTIMKRNLPLYIVMIAQSILMGVIISTVYINLSSDFGAFNPDVSPVFSRYGVVFTILLQTMLSGMGTMGQVIQNRPVFYRHRDNFFYRTLTLCIVELLLFIPIAFAQSFIFGVLSFFICNLVPGGNQAGPFFTYLLFLFVGNLNFTLLFQAIGATSASSSIGQILAALIIVFNVLFSGFIINPANILSWCIWIYYIVPVAWVFRAVMLSIFHSDGFTESQTLFALSIGGFEDYEQNYIWYGFTFLFGSTLLNFSLKVLALTNLTIISGKKVANFTASFDIENEDINGRCKALTEVSAPDAKLDDYPELSLAIEKPDIIPLESKNFIPITLAFKKLVYSVPSPFEKGEELDLLKGISGYMKPGTMTALMGSSGAGKTTLMDVIAGRKNSGTIRGDILVNGRPKDAKSFARVIGYVEQLDIHSSTQTVYEAVLYSALLRQSSEVKAEEKVEFTKTVLKMFDLDVIQDLKIGEKTSGGLSTEQAKRVTIAVEVAANPGVLFADEPTSGLESHAASIVMKGIRNVALNNRTVVCTIHQPSRQIFESFDRLLLLKKGGEVVYFGELGPGSKTLVDYLEGIVGTPKIPNSRYNPANYMLEVIGAGTSSNQVHDYAAEWKAGEEFILVNQEIESSVAKDLASPELLIAFDHEFASNTMTQFKVLMEKWSKTYWRSPSFNVTRTVINLVLALLFGFVYYQLDITSITSVSSIAGICYLGTIFIGVININSTIPVISAGRAPFYREKAVKMYSSFPYVAASLISELPYSIINSFFFVAPFYYLVGLPNEAPIFFTYWFIFFEYCLLMNFMGHLFSYITPSEMVATIFAGVLNGIFGIFAGFAIAVADITTFWQFMAYITPLRYCFAALIQNTFLCPSCYVTGNDGFTPLCNEDKVPCDTVCDTKSLGCDIIEGVTGENRGFVTASQYIEIRFQFGDDVIWKYIGVLAGFICFILIFTGLGAHFLNYAKR